MLLDVDWWMDRQTDGCLFQVLGPLTYIRSHQDFGPIPCNWTHSGVRLKVPRIYLIFVVSNNLSRI